jgi:hypothetical protein
MATNLQSLTRPRRNTLPALALALAAVSSLVHAADLTIDDGVVVKFGADTSIVVRDTLRVGGPVTFTGLKDDSIAGQTGVTAQTPAAGDWRGVKIEASSSNLKLDELSIRYGGASGEAGLALRKISPTLKFLSVDASVLGVRVTDGAAPRFEGLTLTGNGVGLEIDGNASPAVIGSDIHGNTSFGARNLTPATVVPATGNWWGDASGPRDAIGNPQGAGDAVSSGINYGSFLAAAPPIDPTLRVAGGITFTEQPTVTLLLSCRNATEYRIAENGNFSGVAFQPMAASVPFTLSVGDGLKALSVQYRSSAGNIATALLAQAILLDTAGPVLAITNPADASFINGSITLQATATDPAGVARVEFYIDNVLVATDTAAPYSYAWDVGPVANGTHSIRVAAFDAVGHSSTRTNTITLAKALPPPPDTDGPALAALALGGTAIANGSVVTRSGTITVNVTDRSGVSRVEFLLDNVLFATDTNGADGYAAFLDIVPLTDGAHTLTIRAFDSLNNFTAQSTNITVALAAPGTPTIATPASGIVTNQTQVTVTGTAEKNAQVTINDNGAAAAGPVATDAAGKFTLTVPLTEGANQLQAAASNRGGASAPSAPVQVTRDTSIPAAPLGLNGIAQPSGKIRLTWNRSLDAKVAGYNIYRAAQPFDAIVEAVKVNGAAIPIGTTLVDDVPPVDGTYFYRIVALNSLSTPSTPSSTVSAVSDNTLPKALQITYAPTGRVDTTTGRVAVGRVDVTVRVSEPLLTAPFLSIAPQNGVPIAVDLLKSTDTMYTGSFTITPITPSGVAFAVFSARDIVGNRGTDIVAGVSLTIDAQGPTLTGLALNPATPIKNSTTTPVTITTDITLNEAIKSGSTPQLSYTLSSSPNTSIPIPTSTQTGPLTWRASFTLSSTAGGNQVELLSFSYSGADDLDNVSTAITAANSFQVYQGQLPPLTTPLDFAGVAQPAGKVRLSWRTVESASAYQLFRQAPSDPAPVAYQRVNDATAAEFTDQTSADGLYRYAIASVRAANGQEALSAQSNLVSVTADALAPDAPQNLALLLVGSGIQATWTAPTGAPASYNLYRSSALTITSVQGLTPIKTGVKQLGAVDPNPNLNEHAYAVTALDAAGNESAPSTSVYLNFALVPVSNLTVAQTVGALPVITWTHNGASIAGFDVFLGPDPGTKLNLTPLLDRTYTDSGYANDERRYTVVAFDANDVRIGRSITLPKIESKLIAGTPLKRGVMNRLTYQVSNNGTGAVFGARVKAKVGTRETLSEVFSLNAGETKPVDVVVGGFADIANQAALTSTVEIVPNEGEKVSLVRTQGVEAQDGALVLAVAPQDFIRGASGKARFTLENTSEADIEILTATNTGKNPSSDIRYKLIDKDGNVLATQSFRQSLGGNVVTLASGLTVARLAPRESFTSDLSDIPVPSSAPNDIAVEVDIDRLHYRLGAPEGVSIPGLTSRHVASLIDTPYFGEITNITPTSSFGDRDVVIAGRAVSRATTQALPNAALRLILNVNGFERKFDVFTDATGAFSYPFKPTASDGGVYKVSLLHPDMFERPVQGQFVINSVAVSPTLFKLTNARNYPFTIKFHAQAGDGTVASNLRVVYEAQSQTNGVFPNGVNVTLGQPTNLGSRLGADLAVTVNGDNSATETGSLFLRVLTDERGAEPIANLRIDYRFTQAVPTLNASPSFVETGLARGGSVTEQVLLDNRGFADALNITATLLNPDGTPAPSWIYLMSDANVGTLAVGEKRTLDLAVAPPSDQNEGIYSFKLRLASSNAPGGDIPIYVSITQSGIGNALFKASDIFTGTLDSAGKRIAGLSATRIVLQNEAVISDTHTLTTDNLGEVFFTNIPAGRYKFRANALNHQEVIGRISVKPGVTATEDVFLDFNLVTVEWSVREITLQDKYEIILTSTFQTDVPAAVVVMEPSGVTLPTMKPGEVFFGELNLTNYGLIRADTVAFTPPATDGFFRFEFLKDVPTALEAKQRVTIPYRIVSLSSLDNPSGTGGGCFTYQRDARVGYEFFCANGTKRPSSTTTSWFYTYGTCLSAGGGTTSGGSGGSGGTGGGGVGGGSIGSIGGGAPSNTPLPGVKCIPKPPCDTCCIGCGPGGSGGPSGGPMSSQ